MTSGLYHLFTCLFGCISFPIKCPFVFCVNLAIRLSFLYCFLGILYIFFHLTLCQLNVSKYHLPVCIFTAVDISLMNRILFLFLLLLFCFSNLNVAVRLFIKSYTFYKKIEFVCYFLIVMT